MTVYILSTQKTWIGHFLRRDNYVNYSLNVSLCVNFLGDEVFENSMFSSLVHMIRDGDIYEAQIISY